LDIRQQLITLLADGSYHSGETLGAALQISRSAVWKQLQWFNDAGIELERCKRRGYRIPGGLSLLDAKTIHQQLCPAASVLLSHLEILSQIDSTNELAMQRARQGDASGSVFLAEMQTAGKGRRGRVWTSPFGRNIYLSTIQGFTGGVAAAEGLSLVVGVAVVQSLQGVGIEGLSLKWPNDILWHGQKLGGILLEIGGDPAGDFDVIVGLGLNVNMPAIEGREIGQDWVSLATIAAERIDRSELVATLLNGLLPVLASFEVEGFARYRDAWQALDCFFGETVTLMVGDNAIVGIARGVSSSGALLLETDKGMREYSGGEISVRKLP
jgi:BirA family biotin operon repressor/biotin-[acetyl-CoA-carboxylase] ligase